MSYGYPYGTPQPQVALHEHDEFDELETTLNEVKESVEALERFRYDIEQQVGDVDLDDLSDDVENTGNKVTSLSGAVKSLGARIGWIEQVLRQANLMQDADLDSVDAELRALAEQARAGRRARTQILDDQERGAKQQQFAAVARARRENSTAVEAAAAASEILGRTVLGDPTHAEATESFKAARRTLDSSAAIIKNRGAHAEQCARELAEDERTRKELSSVLSVSTTAETQLTTRLRTRIVAAIGKNASMPDWFAISLGYTAPATERNAWFDLATDVLAYRVVYQVRDEASALGPRPPYNDPDTPRRDLHYGLQNRLRRLGT